MTLAVIGGTDLVWWAIALASLLTLFLSVPTWMGWGREAVERRRRIQNDYVNRREREAAELTARTRERTAAREEEARARRRRTRLAREAYERLLYDDDDEDAWGAATGPRVKKTGPRPEIHLEARGGAECALCREPCSEEPCKCGSVVHAECSSEMSDGLCPTPGCGSLRYRKSDHWSDRWNLDPLEGA